MSQIQSDFDGSNTQGTDENSCNYKGVRAIELLRSNFIKTCMKGTKKNGLSHPWCSSYCNSSNRSSINFAETQKLSCFISNKAIFRFFFLSP